MKKYDSMLFNYGTSNRTDYQEYEITAPIIPIHTERPKCLVIRPPPLKYVHTLTPWKKPNIPFTLYFRPKEVTRTNPRQVQQYYEKAPDLSLEFAKKTRPRLVMTPAISMDDISPSEKRQILVRDVYSTTTHIAMREGIAGAIAPSVHAVAPGTPAPAMPITLQKPQAPYVSPEWRMETASWDARQLRAYCEPDKEFYLARKTRCDACDVTAAIKRQAKIVKTNKTR